MYLDRPEVGVEPLAFSGAHQCVVKRCRHSLGHAFVSKLHPPFGEVTLSRARLLLLSPQLAVCRQRDESTIRFISLD